MENPFLSPNLERPNSIPHKDALFAKYEARRADLKPQVRGYADRLQEGILGFLRSHGARSVKELFELQKSGKIRSGKAASEKLIKMLSALESALNKNELPELKEIATIGPDEKFVFAGERIFVVNEEDDMRFGEPEVSFYPLDSPEEKWYFHNDWNRYAVDRDGGRILRVDDRGRMWDMQNNPIGPTLTEDMSRAFLSGGTWFAYSEDSLTHRYLHVFNPGKDDWDLVHQPDPGDWDLAPKVDNGKVYELRAYDDTYQVNEGKSKEVISGRWQGYNDWKVVDGVVFFMKSEERGLVFYMGDEPLYSLDTEGKLTGWNVNHGMLYASLLDEEGDQRLYCIDLKITGQPKKSKAEEDFDLDSQDRW